MDARVGKLYVVATPIGNLEDLSPRAIRVLAEVDVVAAEDTRVTGRLLARQGIKQPMVSYRDETERRMAAGLVERLLAGENIALVSDAGTPGISDPGYRLVCAAADAGIDVVAVAGPSAVTALLSVSGLPTDRFSFEGFPPPRREACRKFLRGLDGSARTLVFYESPRRVVAFLEDVAKELGDPPVAVGRELTKLYEEVVRGSASAVAEIFREKGTRGEFVVAVSITKTEVVLDDDALRARIGELLADGLSVRDAAAELKDEGVSRRKVYELARDLDGDANDSDSPDDSGAPS